jgi:hypothetical protein
MTNLVIDERAYARRPQRAWRRQRRRAQTWSTRKDFCAKRSQWFTAPVPTSIHLISASGGDRLDSFERLKNQWKSETANVSSLSQIILNDAYQQIIGMGPRAIPLILSSLREELDWWFPALRALTGANPVREADLGDLEAMRAAWLEWAVLNGYLRRQ